MISGRDLFRKLAPFPCSHKEFRGHGFVYPAGAEGMPEGGSRRLISPDLEATERAGAGHSARIGLQF